MRTVAIAYRRACTTCYDIRENRTHPSLGLDAHRQAWALPSVCSSKSSQRFAPMETLNRQATVILRRLCRLFLPAIPKITFSRGLLKALKRIDLAHDPPRSPGTEADIAGAESPELPVDILMNILSLLEIPDLLRAGSVCSTWHATFKNMRTSHGRIYQRHQTPCLLYTSESDPDNVACIYSLAEERVYRVTLPDPPIRRRNLIGSSNGWLVTADIYSLAEERVYRVTLPDPPIRRRNLIGSSNGWLVTADERSELLMVNPITGEQIALPPVTTIEQVKPILDDAGEIQEYELSHHSADEVYRDPSIRALHDLRDSLYFKAFVFFDGSRGGHIVVLIHEPYEISFARAGDSRWTWLWPASDHYEDCIYVDGILYAVTSTSAIHAFDLTGPTYSMKVIMEESKRFIVDRIYITQAPSGELLLVWRDRNLKGDAQDCDTSEFMKGSQKFMLFVVDMEAKELMEIDSLYDHVLFLGCSQSCCLDAEDFPSLQANHVYLTGDERYIRLLKEYHRDVLVFNMESNSLEEIVLPRFRCSWPVPIWMTPNLSKMN
ncbi:hypothetical protein HU200_048616 [Digitaria exilis]|uniref:F-box domain-containing protein n=1 Tax=Digitaria exilis TaxID=1010633 RepID=A0A835AV29_9POAL|nr:hypothetical protein HU200_048616 [Digitaria exilis]